VLDAQLRRPCRGTIVETNGGLPSWQALYLDLLPPDATHAKAEHL
jgi:hypothetical protein